MTGHRHMSSVSASGVPRTVTPSAPRVPATTQLSRNYLYKPGSPPSSPGLCLGTLGFSGSGGFQLRKLWEGGAESSYRAGWPGWQAAKGIGFMAAPGPGGQCRAEGPGTAAGALQVEDRAPQGCRAQRQWTWATLPALGPPGNRPQERQWFGILHVPQLHQNVVPTELPSTPHTRECCAWPIGQ